MAQTPDQFAAELLKATALVTVAVEKVVGKGGQNIKDQAKRNVLASAPTHNAGAHRTITYDDPTVGKGTISTEIGYSLKSGRAAYLGPLLEFGGGGDHSPPHHDLSRALEDEAPRFEGALQAVVTGLLK